MRGLSEGPKDKGLIAAGTPPISMCEGAQAMARILDSAPDTEAVICVSGLSAFGALAECQRRGIAVPGQISVCGFGDYVIAGTCVPSLTTVDPHPIAIGRETAAIIVRSLEVGGGLEPRVVRIAPDLIARESSRLPAQGPGAGLAGHRSAAARH